MTQDLILQIHIQPNARRDEVVSFCDQVLKVKIQAPAVDGKANKELIRFLANTFNVPPSTIQILKGEHSRHKKVLIPAPRQIPEYLAI